MAIEILTEQIPQKQCVVCKQCQPITQFRKSRNSYRSQCRNCTRLQMAKWKGTPTEKIEAKIARENFLAIYTDLKYCEKGDHFPSRENFNQCSKSRDGLFPTCRDCQKDFRIKNWDKIQKTKLKYRIECHEKVIAMGRANWAKRKDQRNAARRLRRKAEPEYFAEQARRYYAKYPEKIKLNSKYQGMIRRARKLKAPGRYTPGQWQEKLAFYGFRCYLCGKADVKLTQDHKIPLSRGGSNWLSNIAPACDRCNKSKNRKTLKEYRGQLSCSAIIWA